MSMPTLKQRTAAAEGDLRSTLEALLSALNRAGRCLNGEVVSLDDDLLKLLDGQAGQLVKEVARVRALRDATVCVEGYRADRR